MPMFIDNPSNVWLIHGFQDQQTVFISETNTLKKIYPDIGQVSIKRWASPEISNLLNTKGEWDRALAQSQAMVQKLWREIVNLSEEQRQNLILIGHSLGGAIVIRALALCAQNHIKIDHFVIAGAAMDNNDSDLLLALKTVRNKSFSLVNMRDYALGFYCVFEGHAALGTGYMSAQTPENFCEIASSQENSHDLGKYLNKYLSCVQQQKYVSDEILVPQDMLNWRLPVTNGGIMRKFKQFVEENLYKMDVSFWNIVDKMQSWELQQNIIIGQYRIISPEGLRMAWGNKTTMEIAFNKVKKQLEQ